MCMSLAFNDLFAQNQLNSLFICKLASENKYSMSGLFRDKNVVSLANDIMVYFQLSMEYHSYITDITDDPE